MFGPYSSKFTEQAEAVLPAGTEVEAVAVAYEGGLPPGAVFAPLVVAFPFLVFGDPSGWVWLGVFAYVLVASLVSGLTSTQYYVARAGDEVIVLSLRRHRFLKRPDEEVARHSVSEVEEQGGGPVSTVVTLGDRKLHIWGKGYDALRGAA